jgi:hypothetical protein
MTTVLNYSAAGGPEERGNDVYVPSYGAISNGLEGNGGGGKGAARGTYLTPISPTASDLNARLWFKWRRRLFGLAACGMCLGVFGAVAPTIIKSLIGVEVVCPFCLFLSAHGFASRWWDWTARQTALQAGGVRAVQHQHLSVVRLPYDAPDDDVTPPMTPHHRRPSSSH